MEKEKILNLQEQYELGKTAKEEMSKEEKRNLIDLYNEQIKDFQVNLEYYKSTLNSYKNKILVLKNKLSNA